MGYGLLGVIAATLLVQSVIILIAFLTIVSQIGFVIPRFTYIREYLQFSLPLTPNTLVRWVTESSDRYLVTYFLGLESVGIYSAACSFGNLIQLFVSPLQLILFPELSKLYDENRIDEIVIYMSHSLRYFLLISIPAVFGLSALAKPLLSIFTTRGFPFGLACNPYYRSFRTSSRNRSNFCQYTINCQKNESTNLYQFCCGNFECINQPLPNTFDRYCRGCYLNSIRILLCGCSLHAYVSKIL